jgi:hypothetical protein
MPLSIIPESISDEQGKEIFRKGNYNPNQAIEDVESNPYYSQDFARLNNNQTINYEIAEEVVSILREIEQTNFDSAGGDLKYINWETEPIAYDVLRRAGETEPARLIKNKRRFDLIQFGTIPIGENINRGVQLVFDNHDFVPNKEEKALLKVWEKKIIDNFFFPTNDPYPNLGKFLGVCYEDYIDLDDLTWEIRRDRSGKPIAIHAQDPIIYKPVIKPQQYTRGISYGGDEITEVLKNYERLYGIQEKKKGVFDFDDYPDYVLIYQGQKIAVANRDFVRKHHFFVRSKFQKTQRGFPIVEQAIRMITYIMNALKMNAGNFTNSRLPLGFFLFTGGGVNQGALERLKRTLYAYQGGSDNHSKYPMIATKGEKSDAKWIGVRNSSRDAEYHQFMTLLFSIFCQLTGTDPREVALGSYGDAVGKRSLFEEPTDGLVKESKDAGLRTFLKHIETSLNSPNKYGVNLFQEITNLPVKIQFVGFEIEDKKQKLELNSKRLATTDSVNDLLGEQDKEREEYMVGGVNIYDIKGISNPQIFQSVLFSLQQKALQAQQMQQPAQTNNIMEQAKDGGQENHGKEQEIDQKQQEEEPKANNGELTDKDRELLNKYKDIAVMDEDLQNEYYGEN